MRDDLLHLCANLGVAVALWAAALYAIWAVADCPWWGGVLASLASLIACAFVAHRVAPRLTGPLVELLARRRRRSDDH